MLLGAIQRLLATIDIFSSHSVTIPAVSLSVLSRGIYYQGAHGSIAMDFPLSCRLCPNALLPDDSHDICLSYLGHIRDTITDPCLHCSLLPMSERRLCLAELDPCSEVGLVGSELPPATRTLKRCAYAAAGAPPHPEKRQIPGRIVWKRLLFLRQWLPFLLRSLK